MYLVIAGNIVDGMSFHGPFDDIEQATEWAERNLNKSGDEWFVATLNSVD